MMSPAHLCSHSKQTGIFSTELRNSKEVLISVYIALFSMTKGGERVKVFSAWFKHLLGPQRFIAFGGFLLTLNIKKAQRFSHQHRESTLTFGSLVCSISLPECHRASLRTCTVKTFLKFPSYPITSQARL